MIQGAALLFAIIVMFVLVSGLVILWRRGPDELDAWGALSHAYCAAIGGVSIGKRLLILRNVSHLIQAQGQLMPLMASHIEAVGLALPGVNAP